MKDKKKISIIAGVFLLVLLTIGVTYAFFSYIGNGSTENTISSDSITFLYEEIDQQGAGISITNAVPIEDSVGKQGQAFNFRIISNTNSNVSIPYEINVRQKEGTDDIGDIVKLYLTKVDDNNNEEEVELSKYSELRTVTKNNHTEKLLHADKVPASDSGYNQRYRLRMWIDSEANFSDGSKNNKTFAVTVNVYSSGHVQTQEDIEAASNTDVSSITINNTAATLNGDVYEITTQSINTTINVVPTNPYTKVNIEKTDSSYNPIAMVGSHIQRLSTAKSFELEDGDNYFKITLTSEDNSNTDIIKLKIKLNLNFEITVVDTLYPVAKANGFEPGKQKILINYPPLATNKLYQIVPSGSTLNENNWQTYLLGYIDLNAGDTIYAKYVTSNGRESQTINYVSAIPDDAIGSEAYDGDPTTSFYNEINNKYYHVSVSQSSWGQQLKLKVHTVWNRDMYFLDANGNKLNFVYNDNSMNQLDFKGIDNIIISIPQNAVSFGFYHGYTHIYEIEVVPAITKQSSSKTTATSTGIIPGSKTVIISYDSTATQKLYKIDDGNWQTYNNQPIKVNYNQTLYAKSIYENGNDSINSYQVPVDDTVLVPEAYDGNSSTYDYYGAERNGKYNYIMIDSSAWGKTLRVNVDGAYSREYYFVDSSNNRISFDYNGSSVTAAALPKGTTDIVIPEGAVSFGHYHGFAKVYELEIIN